MQHPLWSPTTTLLIFEPAREPEDNVVGVESSTTLASTVMSWFGACLSTSEIEIFSARSHWREDGSAGRVFFRRSHKRRVVLHVSFHCLRHSIFLHGDVAKFQGFAAFGKARDGGVFLRVETNETYSCRSVEHVAVKVRRNSRLAGVRRLLDIR